MLTAEASGRICSNAKLTVHAPKHYPLVSCGYTELKKIIFDAVKSSHVFYERQDVDNNSLAIVV